MSKSSDHSSNSRLCTPAKRCAKLIKCGQIFSTFFIFYISSLVLIVPFILLLLWRLIITVIFKLFYKGKYKLLNRDDATFAPETPANLSAFTLFTFIKGHCDIKLLRERLLENCFHYTDNGAQPYLKLLHGLVIKYGFFCWHDVSITFDICHHIKYFPSKGDFDRVYTESEIFDELSIGNKEWDCDKPKWEILVVPKVKLESSRNYKVCYVLILRFHPAYLDGISLVQFVRKCILDQQPPVDFMIDPINPYVPSQPLCFKVLKCLQVFLLGPWVMQNLDVKETNIFCSENQQPSPTYFGRTKSKITLGHIQTLRKTLKCSTTSIFSYVFVSALRRLAELKGFEQEIPETIFGGISIPLLPYPDDNMHNLCVTVFKPLNVGIEDTLERIQSVHETVNDIKDFDNEYILIATHLYRRWVGLCPAKWIGKSSKKINCTFLLSNLPGMKGVGRVNEFDAKIMFGCPPVMNQFGLSVGFGCYNDKYTVCFTAEKSTLIQNRHDLEILIAEFETQLEMLQNDSWYWQ